MKKISVLIATLVSTLALGSVLLNSAEQSRMLAHDVYFTLKDNSKDAKAKLVKACHEYLADHPGTVWFDVGVLVQEHEREVNDRAFDIALHLLFKDKAAHDAYQKAPRHARFIKENEANWKKVRVFDSWVVRTAHSQATEGHGEHGEHR